jgi:hypothetical protein
MIGFSRWRSFDEVGEAPQVAGVFQIKVQQLLAYPSGKSAMVYYGSGDDLRAALTRVAPSLERFGEIVWRVFETASHAAELARHLKQFTERFGAVPAGN